MKLLIAADDYTGALDTGVKLAQQGVSTAVVDAGQADRALALPTPDVLVVSTESRHQSPREAYDTVYRLIRKAREAWPQAALYKKTDSALRGNIGSELAAMLDASGERFLAYVPALPAQGRTTVNGCQLDHGLPVHKTVFAQDCYAPITKASIPQIIREQTSIPVFCVPIGQTDKAPSGKLAKKSIWVYDSETLQDMQAAARALKKQQWQRLTAGCAGFAACLPQMLDLEGGAPEELRIPARRLCVICGSVNPITQRQLKRAGQRGLPVVTLPAEVIMNPAFDAEREARALLQKVPAGGSLAVTTADAGVPGEKMAYARQLGMEREDVRRTISLRLGRLTDLLCKMDGALIPMLIGGDTLSGFLRAAGCGGIRPWCEPQTGCVLSTYEKNGEKKWMLSKSGGIGSEDILIKLMDALEEKNLCLKAKRS